MPGREVRLQVRMGEHLRSFLRHEAARTGMSDSQFVREAIVAYAGWRRGIDERGADHSIDVRDPAVVARLLADG